MPELGPPVDVFVRLRPTENMARFRLRDELPPLEGKTVSEIGEMCAAGERLFLKRCLEFELESIKGELADLPVAVEVDRVRGS